MNIICNESAKEVAEHLIEDSKHIGCVPYGFLTKGNQLKYNEKYTSYYGLFRDTVPYLEEETSDVFFDTGNAIAGIGTRGLTYVYVYFNNEATSRRKELLKDYATEVIKQCNMMTNKTSEVLTPVNDIREITALEGEFKELTLDIGEAKILLKKAISLILEPEPLRDSKFSPLLVNPHLIVKYIPTDYNLSEGYSYLELLGAFHAIKSLVNKGRVNYYQDPDQVHEKGTLS